MSLRSSPPTTVWVSVREMALPPHPAPSRDLLSFCNLFRVTKLQRYAPLTTSWSPSFLTQTLPRNVVNKAQSHTNGITATKAQVTPSFGFTSSLLLNTVLIVVNAIMPPNGTAKENKEVMAAVLAGKYAKPCIEAGLRRMPTP